MQKFLSCLLLFLIFIPAVMSGQVQDSTRSEVQEDIEEVLEVFDPQTVDINSEQLIQFLQGLAADPVNINKATDDDLLQIPGINLKNARAIIEYRTKVKPFENIDELDKVPGIGRVTLEKMRPYVSVGSGLELSRMLYTDPQYWTKKGRFQAFSRFQQDLQQAEGYKRSPEDGGYAGSGIKYYQRMGYKSNHLSLNLTQEKDAGEQLSGPVAFDHQSWHISLEDNRRLQMLVAGDYSLSFGQGLVLWNGGVFGGKGSDVIGAVSRNGRGVDPYTSAQETNYYRGAAATYGNKIQFTGFFSKRKRTASEIDTDTTRFPSSDGYHRTSNEISQKNNLGQALYGGNIQLDLPFGIIGATGYSTTFDRYITPSDQVYAHYDFEGRTNAAFGADYRLLVGPVILFGEGGRTQNGGMGLISGLESALGDDTELTMAYRNYQKDFQSIYGDGFGEASGEPQNETGIYLGLRHTLTKSVTLSAYVDQFRFPGPRFGTHQPTQGYDWLGKAEVELARDLNFYIQLRSESKEDEYEISDSFGRIQRTLGDARRGSYRANLEYWINRRVRLRTRGELVRSRQAGEEVEQGYLLYQDLRLLVGKKLQVDTRVTVFDTKSYAARVYQYENDLLYVFSSQPLYNQGQRMYVLLNYEPSEFLEFWGKFGVTIYEDQQVIGSGRNEIQGNVRSELSLQARVVF